MIFILVDLVESGITTKTIIDVAVTKKTKEIQINIEKQLKYSREFWFKLMLQTATQKLKDQSAQNDNNAVGKLIQKPNILRVYSTNQRRLVLL